MPLENKVFISNSSYFKGLFGVFFDSLPDGWGEYLVRKMFKSKGINFDKVSVLTRLSILSIVSLGGLEYIPRQLETSSNTSNIDLDVINDYINNELNDYGDESYFDELLNLGGASGGAKPKVHLNIKNEE